MESWDTHPVCLICSKYTLKMAFSMTQGLHYLLSLMVHCEAIILAAMPGFLSSTYNYMNLFVLMVGVLGIVFDEHADIVFMLSMAIVNLIIKPFTAFLLFRVSQERGGNYSVINFPGVSNFPGFGGRGGTYEDIDRSSPQHASIETAEPHKTLEKPSNP
ncbi:hypothetical protein ACJMK2_007166 [Sinanodonta woodiana]|uniref:Uncharacterized protein n=1 Tax=Sinanodonta woodiana TaxID=1069815 RepID=A0ABD3VKU3_SINWO